MPSLDPHAPLPPGVIRLLVLLATLLGSCPRACASPHSSLLPPGPPQPHHKCENKRGCPTDHFAFRIISGAANVVGPSICFEDRILMSTVKNNIGRGLNIALVNGELGPGGPKASCTANFRTASTTVHLETFLQEIKDGTIMLAATYDDAATKMNNKVQALFSALGSRHVNQLGFRDNWVFLGAKGMKGKSPFEEHIKNDQKTNKYDGWPELLDMEGCAPRKQD
uniref:Family with sequence similarity 3 member D n=1 Tax=Pavo cristatus TaxID=9049 RepID=A0A8C9FLW4_PAVCR